MIFAAILAGGIGTRFNGDAPKQFFEINNKPLLVYCIEQFLKVEELDKIIVSSPKEYLSNTKLLVDKNFSTDKIVVIVGGKTRNDTIVNSINYAMKNDPDDDSVMVTHDAARIFVSPNLIKNSIKYAMEYGAASPVIPATDVIFQSKRKGQLDYIPKRKYLFHSQTPQSFKIKEFMDIYNSLSEDEIELLDEAMMLFYLRNKNVYLFEGDSENFKITRPFDIKIAESILGDKFEIH